MDGNGVGVCVHMNVVDTGDRRPHFAISDELAVKWSRWQWSVLDFVSNLFHFVEICVKVVRHFCFILDTTCDKLHNVYYLHGIEFACVPSAIVVLAV